MGKGRIIIALLILISLGFSGGTFPETIKLKSGETIEGEIIEKTNEYIKIDFYGIPLTYYLEDIAPAQQSQTKDAAKNLSLDVDSSVAKPYQSQLPIEIQQFQPLDEVQPVTSYVDKIGKIVLAASRAVNKIETEIYETKGAALLDKTTEEVTNIINSAQQEASKLIPPPGYDALHSEAMQTLQAIKNTLKEENSQQIQVMLQQAIQHMANFAKEFTSIKRHLSKRD